MRKIRRMTVFGVALCVVLVLNACRYDKDEVKGTGVAKPGQVATSMHDTGPFELVAGVEGKVDNSPALTLTFSQLLDPKTDYDAVIDVYKMPGQLLIAKQPGGGEVDVSEADNHSYGDGVDNESAPPATTGANAVSTKPADVNVNGGTRLKGGWVVGDNPHLLQLPRVETDTRYVVVVHPDLRDRDGKVLGKPARYSIHTVAIDPTAYFASNGMVLAARQNGGLPVVTENVGEVDVEFLRVMPNRLPAFLQRVINAPPAGASDPDAPAAQSNQRRWWWQPDTAHIDLHGQVANNVLNSLQDVAQSVYHGRFLTDPRQNRRNVTFLPVESIKELSQPGVYVAVMNRPGHFDWQLATTYFYVSDRGITLREFDKAADVFVSSLTDGKAVSDVRVSWLDQQGATLSQAMTDGNGHIAFAERPAKARVLIASKAGQISVIALHEPALDLSEFPITGDAYRPVRLFAYSGRDLYRPGEQIDVSVLARDADGRPVPAQPIQATLLRADGRKQFVSNWRPDPSSPGYFHTVIELPEDAPTGMWSLALRVDPADKVPGGVMNFHVEEFMPQRMKMDLASDQPSLGFGDNFNVVVHGAYLFGAPAAGNRLLTEVTLKPDTNPLSDKLKGYVFGDIDAKAIKIASPDDTALDQSGAGKVAVSLPKETGVQTPYDIKATFTLLENGGRPLVQSISRTIWPAKAMVAVRPLFGDYVAEDGTAEFEVTRVDADGHVQPEAALPVRLIRENRDYYWHMDSDRGWMETYDETDEPVETTSVTIDRSGHAKLHLPLKYGSYRLEISDPATHLTLRYRFQAGWSWDVTQSELGQRPDHVGLMLDKKSYRGGDTAKLTVTAPHHGQTIVTVEADHVLWNERITINSDRQVVDIPVSPDWKRHDLYIGVSVLRPGNEGETITPVRAVGLIPLSLDREDRRLAITIAAADKIRPETTVPVRISVPGAAAQRAMVTLSVVDVGILNITQFKTPDPWQFFFGQLRYGADQHDIYGRLIEKMAGVPGTLKFGGDKGTRAKPHAQQKIKLIDVFRGPVTLDTRGNATIQVRIPDFNGKVRLMAVVATPDRFGSGERDMTVAAPLIAELNTPRFIAFGDKATLALDLHNLSGKTQHLRVLVSGDNALNIANGVHSLTLPQLERTTLSVGLTAGSSPGLHHMHVHVDGDGISIDRDFPLEVEAPWSPRQYNTYHIVDPRATLQLDANGLASLYPSTATSHLVVSDRPPIDLKRVIKGLLQYPFGCVEQTVSGAYPYLYIDEAMAQRYGLTPYTRLGRANIIDRVMSKLAAMQSRSGGFSLWGGENNIESWPSAYATAFMQDARSQGFIVPDPMYQKAMDYLLRDLQDGDAGIADTDASKPQPLRQRNLNGNSRAYHELSRTPEALAFESFVLARANRAPLSAMRDLYDRRQWMRTSLSKMELGIAFKLMGDSDRAQTLFKEAVATDRGDISRSHDWWSWIWWIADYGSEIRDIAQSYALAQQYGVKVSGTDQWLAQLADKLRGSYFLDTQEQMAVFMAVQSLGNGGTAWQVGINDGKATHSVDGKGPLVVDINPLKLATTKLVNHSNEKLYVMETVAGVSRDAPTSTGDFQLDRTLYQPDGTVIGNRPLKVGETVIVEVDVWPAHDYQTATAMVVDRVPAGLEIENLNLVKDSRLSDVKFAGVNAEAAMQDPNIMHVEFRDDRFVAALRLGSIYWNSSDPVKLFYQARVVTPGQFVMPGVHAEDMYNENVVDDDKSSMLSIVNPSRKMDPVKSEADTPSTSQ